MKRRQLVPGTGPVLGNVASNSATTATGEHCPATGWWIPQGTTESWQYVSEGNLMPAHRGNPTRWVPGALAPASDDSIEIMI
jgi:hypothetical protein